MGDNNELDALRQKRLNEMESQFVSNLIHLDEQISHSYSHITVNGLSL